MTRSRPTVKVNTNAVHENIMQPRPRPTRRNRKNRSRKPRTLPLSFKISSANVKFMVGPHHVSNVPGFVKESPLLIKVHLKVIHNLDLNSTWMEVMKKECGVELDPEEYHLHKRNIDGQSMDDVRKHDLRELTSVLMNTFRMTKPSGAPFIVYLNKIHGTFRPLPPGSSSATPGESSTTVAIRPNNTRPMPLSKKLNAIKMATMPARQKQGGRGRSVLPLPKPPTTRRPRSSRPVVVPDDLNFDTRSNHSDDSQLNDLEERGIPVDENLRGKVCVKIRRNYSNSCFLRARKEMLELKRKPNSTRWAKVTSEVPTVMAIFQALLEI